MDLRLSTQHQDGHALLTLEGELDLGSKVQFVDSVYELVRAGSRTVRADLRGLTFCDSSGLSGLILASTICRNAGGTFSVFGAQEGVAEVLTLTGLDRALVDSGAAQSD